MQMINKFTKICYCYCQFHAWQSSHDLIKLNRYLYRHSNVTKHKLLRSIKSRLGQPMRHLVNSKDTSLKKLFQTPSECCSDCSKSGTSKECL